MIDPSAAAQVTPDDLKAAGHVLIGFATILVAVLGFLVRTAFKMGKDAQKVASSLESLSKIEVAVAEIPKIIVRLGTVEKAWETTRSDIKHLLRNSRPGIQTPPPPAPAGGSSEE